MRDGFVKVAAVTPEVRVADVAFNVEACVAAAREAAEKDGAVVIVLPELALTGYTCEDLFWQDALIRAADAGLADFAEATAEVGALIRILQEAFNQQVSISLQRPIPLVQPLELLLKRVVQLNRVVHV